MSIVDEDSRGRARHDYDPDVELPHAGSCRVCGLGERNEIHRGRLRMVTAAPTTLIAILDTSAGDLVTNDRYLAMRDTYAEQLAKEAR